MKDTNWTKKEVEELFNGNKLFEGSTTNVLWDVNDRTFKATKNIKIGQPVYIYNNNKFGNLACDNSLNLLKEKDYANKLDLEYTHIDLNKEESIMEEKGKKFDGGKSRAGLVVGGFAKALSIVAKIGTFGALKYGPDNWKNLDDALERYEDAMMRHYLAMKDGELLDPESELPHVAHMAWNALAMVHFMHQEDS